MKKKKICFFSGDITRSGGTEKVACQIMNGLEQYYEIFVVSMVEKNESVFFSLSDNISRDALFADMPIGKKHYPEIVFRLRKYIKQNSIDILVDIDTILDSFAVLALVGLKTKLISWEHFNFEESLGSKLRVPVRKCVTRLSDCVVTLTREDQETYRRHYGKRHRIVHIYNPVESIRTELEYDPTSKRLISVGRLVEPKGYDYLIEVARNVFQRHPDWEWGILGEGDERAMIEKKIAEYRLTQLHLLGQVKNVDDYLQSAAVFVMTSRHEGFPLALIEAKANKLPAVSFDCRTGPSELIRHGVDGYLIPCYDIERMSERICELIEDVEARCSFSGRAQESLRQLEYNTVINRWNRLIERLSE